LKNVCIFATSKGRKHEVGLKSCSAHNLSDDGRGSDFWDGWPAGEPKNKQSLL